ncbi:MAG: DUF808 domain-containing protein [Candidatus Sericytochromatia bacterium]|nr:DUF808 domain-containing protein [Candidatus Sericytochromatia bacterium]
MAGASLLTLIDDIATLLQKVSLMTQMAAKKTAGVLGDDLALNAQQVTGVSADRELPVVWAVAKGSAKNKLILVPAALAISSFLPWAVTPLLMLGGAFLCYEGCEKLLHSWLHRHDKSEEIDLEALANLDMASFEKEKIQGAIRTDFILSAEIIVISLGTVAAESFGMQLAVLTGISVLMTIGVYGLVAGIVKLDDLGLYLSQREGLQRQLGFGILKLAPYLMKALSSLGMLAMFLVGGGILVHGIAPLHHWVEHLAHDLPALLAWFVPSLTNLVTGLLIGSVLVALHLAVDKLRGKSPAH